MTPEGTLAPQPASAMAHHTQQQRMMKPHVNESIIPQHQQQPVLIKQQTGAAHQQSRFGGAAAVNAHPHSSGPMIQSQHDAQHYPNGHGISPAPVGVAHPAPPTQTNAHLSHQHGEVPPMMTHQNNHYQHQHQQQHNHQVSANPPSHSPAFVRSNNHHSGPVLNDQPPMIAQEPMIGPTPHPHHHNNVHHQPQQVDMQPSHGQPRPISQQGAPTFAVQAQSGPVPGLAPRPTRISIPSTRARGHESLFSPFKIEHESQYFTKVFLLGANILELLIPQTKLQHPNDPHPQHPLESIVFELQLRAYQVSSVNDPQSRQQQGDSLLNNKRVCYKNNRNGSQISNLIYGKQCHWPESLQLYVNDQLVSLERTQRGFHKPLNLSQLVGEGSNKIDFEFLNPGQCMCDYDFSIELVECHLVRSLINGLLKTNSLHQDRCVQKIRLAQQVRVKQPGLELVGVMHMGQEIPQVKLSLRCPAFGVRISIPARGANCRHIQCFDLERFLMVNQEKLIWNCPICSCPIQSSSIEIDQHQANIIRELGINHHNNGLELPDEILVDDQYRWQNYVHSPRPMMNTGSHNNKQTPLPTSVAASHQQNYPTTNVQRQAAVVGQQQQTPYTAQPVWNQQQSASQGPVASATSQQLPQQAASPRPRTTVVAQAGNNQNRGGRRSATGSPFAPTITKKPYTGQYANTNQGPGHVSSPAQVNYSSPASNNNNSNHNNNNSGSNIDQSVDEPLDPLAAMERVIIQQEQQMGPPPFEANLLCSPSRPPAQQTTTQNQSQLTNQSNGTFGNNTNQSSQNTPSAPNPSPINRPNSIVPASPQHQRPMSAANSIENQQTTIINSPIKTQTTLPGTPSSIMMHIGPETPATPSSQHCGPNSVPATLTAGQSPHLSHSSSHDRGLTANSMIHEQQPLSNGSPSAGSITSSSTMTPGAQSLGSVGMGGDSVAFNSVPAMVGSSLSVGSHGGATTNCTASGATSQLDDLLNGKSGNHLQNNGSLIQQHGESSSSHFGGASGQAGSQEVNELGFCSEVDKSDILMNKLLMDEHTNPSGSSERGRSLLARVHQSADTADLTLALEEAKWKQREQQLEARGKSEHLANFLNEPMTKRGATMSLSGLMNRSTGAQQMLSGGLNPSDDESDHPTAGSGGATNSNGLPISSIQSSPSIERELETSGVMQEFSSYLDADSADNGAGLPPDDSILDLFG